jgi:CheY-like chemotaxis protein
MTSDPGTQQLMAHIHQLRKSYLSNMDKEVTLISEMVESLVEQSDAHVKVDISQRLRNVASAAGAFGLTELSARARLLEQTLEATSPSNLRDFLNSVRKMHNAAIRPDETTPPDDGMAPLEMSEAPSSALKLLVIGDDAYYASLLREVLKSQFHVMVVHSGAAALEHYQQYDADIILLDVNIPDLSGYELSQQLDAARPRGWRSLVFLSSHNRVEEKLKAFDAGAEDYIVRPITLEDLSAKLKILSAYTKSRKDLLEQNQQTRKLAFDSMAEVAQYGRMVDFMRQAMGCKNHDELIKIFFDTMDGFSLKCCLRLSDPYRCFSSLNQPASPIESNLMEALIHSGRLNHLGKRTVVNGKYTGFLVKNMPVEDDIAYGRIKDMVAVMIEALDACFVSIARQQALGLGIQELSKVADRVAKVVLSQDSPVQVMVKRLEQLMRQLESSFDFMDLNEQQEKFLFGLLNQGAMDATLVAEQLGSLRSELNDINHSLMKYQS